MSHSQANVSHFLLHFINISQSVSLPISLFNANSRRPIIVGFFFFFET